MDFRPRRLSTIIMASLLVISIVMVIVSAYVTHSNTVEKDKAIETLLARYRSIHSTTQLQSYLKDVESAQHGYLATGDNSFIRSYDDAKLLVKNETDTLERLIVDLEPEIRTLTAEVIRAVNNKEKDVALGIEIYQHFGKDSAAKRLATRIGKKYGDTLRTAVSNLVTYQRELFLMQNEMVRTKSKVDDEVRFLAFLLIGLISLAALTTLFQNQRDIERLINNLSQANLDLEDKVKERTRQLVEADKAKDQFIAIAYHDLQVPIAGIQRLVMLLSANPDKINPKHAEYLAYIDEACDNMQRMITKFLDIHRIERGDSLIYKKEIRLADVLSRLEKLFTHQALKKNIKLIVEKNDAVIFSDIDALMGALENLVSNAIKFSPRDTAVRITTAVNDSIVRFDVIDQGPGIPEAELPMLFTKHQKLSNKPTGGEMSTGLGLSIAKGLAIQLGGDITVTTREGKGSVFTLSIPLQRHNAQVRR